MFQILKKLLRSEGGWISGAMMLGSMIGNGIMNSKKGKGLGASGLEMSNRAWNAGIDQERMADRNLIQPIKEQGVQGLQSVMPEIFSQRPNSGEYDAIANQEKNLKNQALNTGARGGLLKQQMFEAAKNAASNKMSVMENARQNAAQRGYGALMGMLPNNASMQAQTNTVNQGGQFMVDTELKRKLPVQANNMQNANADQSGLGGGLGSILGGIDWTKLFGGGGTDPYSGMFNNAGTSMGIGGGFAT